MNATALKPRSRPRPRVGIQTQLAKEMASKFRAHLRTNEQIVGSVLADRISGRHRDELKTSASVLLREVEQAIYREYFANQQEAVSATLRSVLEAHVPANAQAGHVIELLAANTRALDEFFLSVAQGRKKRAGGVLEPFFAALFTALEYPYDIRPSDRRGGPGFVFPSMDRLEHDEADCVILIVKRMLRDGWRHLAPRLGTEARTYVATLDVTVSDWDLENFHDQEVTLVVPDHIRLSAYAEVPNVISIESFLSDVIGPRVGAWAQHKIVE